jgi:acetyl-CoA carboxylase biotin carboxyl carrier protein
LAIDLYEKFWLNFRDEQDVQKGRYFSGIKSKSAVTLTKTHVDLKDIKAIIDLMKKNSITEFELERQDSKIRLKRGLNGGSASAEDPISAIPMPLATSQAATTPAISVVAPPPAATGEIEIKSPMIGTFYRAPSPEAGSYVEVGSEVGSETVVCIIEAMKVMNEIKAEVKGVITQILVENAKPVEFGQPLFKVRPN